MSRCLATCKILTPAQAHCVSCHNTFGGPLDFDSHRRHGQCLDPSAVGLVAAVGVWRSRSADTTHVI